MNDTSSRRSRPEDDATKLKTRITELESSRQELERELVKYRTIFDNAVEGIFQIGVDGRIIDANPAAAKILGYGSREEFLASVGNIEEVYPFPEDRAAALEIIRREGFLKEFEVRNRRKDGRMIWVTLNARPVYDGNGNILYNEGTVQDISDRKQMEKDLLSARELSRTLLDIPLDSVLFLMDTEGAVLEMNQNAAIRLGVARSEMIGKSVYSLLSPDVVQSRKEKAATVLKTKAPVRWEGQFKGRYYSSVAYPVFNAEGTVDRIAICAYDYTDLKEAQDERDEILNLSPDLICTVGFDRYFKFVNPAWEKVLGYTQEELLSRPATELLLPEDRARSIAELERVSSGQTVVGFECRIIHKDGSVRAFMWSATPRLEKGFAYCIGRDITERRQIEEKLLESEARFRSYFESPLVGTAITTRDKRLTVNDRFCEMLGYTREELVSMTWADITHPDDLDRDLDHFHRLLDGEIDVYSTDKRYIRRDGSVMWASICAARVAGSDGETEYNILTVQDITDRKRMEVELRQHRDDLESLVARRTVQMQEEIARRKDKEEQYQALVESVIEWIWEFDKDIRHTYVSPRVFEILGYKPEELLGKSPVEFIVPDEHERMVPIIQEVASNRRPFASLRTRAVCKDGRTILIEANGTPFFDKEGGFLGYRGSCRDITEQQRTMDRLKEHEIELLAKSKTLEEVNAALKVLLNQRDQDRRDLEGKFVSNVKEMVLPYIVRMQKGNVDPKLKTYADIAAANLNEIVSPFLSTIRQLNFTPREIEVASLIKEGKSTKEIADIMGLATSAIDSHRNKIRAKLGLNNKKVNLYSYLLSLK